MRAFLCLLSFYSSSFCLVSMHSSSSRNLSDVSFPFSFSSTSSSSASFDVVVVLLLSTSSSFARRKTRQKKQKSNCNKTTYLSLFLFLSVSLSLCYLCVSNVVFQLVMSRVCCVCCVFIRRYEWIEKWSEWIRRERTLCERTKIHTKQTNNTEERKKERAFWGAFGLNLSWLFSPLNKKLFL